MRTIVLDGVMMKEHRQTHEYLAQCLGLPDYYGHNLDALHDCLSEIRESTRLVLYRIDKITDQLGNYGLLLLRVIRESSRQNSYLSVEINQGEFWPESEM